MTVCKGSERSGHAVTAFKCDMIVYHCTGLPNFASGSPNRHFAFTLALTINPNIQ